MRVSDPNNQAHPGKDGLVLFLGSGFSAAVGLPTTNQLSEKLLEMPARVSLRPEVESFITETIVKFWQTIFGWSPGKREPTFEDHFTQIDLAANTGHQLGPSYSPKELRAIRRMTIHRVFTLLESRGSLVNVIHRLFRALNDRFELTIITTNWDCEAEANLDRLGISFTYGLDEVSFGERRPPNAGVPLLKLHGSIHQGYCDCCRMLTNFGEQVVDAAVSQILLLEPSDFSLLCRSDLAETIGRHRHSNIIRTCACGGRIGVRVGTFSYRKDLNPHAFYTVWDRAYTGLLIAKKWLFVGYSLPEADVEIRHALKWTQLARKVKGEPAIDVVLKEDCLAAERYQRFFGLDSQAIFRDGVERWTADRLDEFCR